MPDFNDSHDSASSRTSTTSSSSRASFSAKIDVFDIDNTKTREPLKFSDSSPSVPAPQKGQLALHPVKEQEARKAKKKEHNSLANRITRALTGTYTVTKTVRGKEQKVTYYTTEDKAKQSARGQLEYERTDGNASDRVMQQAAIKSLYDACAEDYEYTKQVLEQTILNLQHAYEFQARNGDEANAEYIQAEISILEQQKEECDERFIQAKAHLQDRDATCSLYGIDRIGLEGSYDLIPLPRDTQDSPDLSERRKSILKPRSGGSSTASDTDSAASKSIDTPSSVDKPIRRLYPGCDSCSRRQEQVVTMHQALKAKNP